LQIIEIYKRGARLGELRKDYILDRWVVISTIRSQRPHQFEEKKNSKKLKACFFCPGHEKETPEEIGRIGTKKKWTMRWFPNKFYAIKPEGQADIRTDNNYFTFSGNYGYHEILVESNDHKKQLWDLSKKEIKTLFQVYNQRIEELSRKPNIYYVAVFKNHGQRGGTSVIHTHSQILAFNHVPKEIREEVFAASHHPSCPYCDIINIEKDSHRRCFENEEFVAFTPYASRFNYEIWVFPKRHIRTLAEANLDKLAEIMKKIMKKLKWLNCSYNYFLHYAPEGEDLHFHIEVCPRIATWAGAELGFGVTINAVPPEQAAEFYRGGK
jgi:UDPglucose--hexose-1-phosphate uridylyltransferase